MNEQVLLTVFEAYADGSEPPQSDRCLLRDPLPLESKITYC